MDTFATVIVICALILGGVCLVCAASYGLGKLLKRRAAEQTREVPREQR